MSDDNDAPLPVPDPTRLSTEAITRGLRTERDYVDGQIGIILARIQVEHEKCKGQYYVAVQRFEDVDKATELLSTTVNRVPTDLQTAIRDVIRLMDERDLRVQARFDANEKLAQTESGLNQTALAAALQAAKEASAVQGVATDRTIDKNAELAAVAAAALGARVTGLTDQLVRVQQQVGEILAGKTAIAEQKTEVRGGFSSVYGAIGVAVGVVGIIIAAISILTR